MRSQLSLFLSLSKQGNSWRGSSSLSGLHSWHWVYISYLCAFQRKGTWPFFLAIFWFFLRDFIEIVFSIASAFQRLVTSAGSGPNAWAHKMWLRKWVQNWIAGWPGHLLPRPYSVTSPPGNTADISSSASLKNNEHVGNYWATVHSCSYPLSLHLV